MLYVRAALAALAAMFLPIGPAASGRVIVEMRTTTGAAAEIFWATDGEAYDGTRSVPLRATADGAWRTYDVEVPTTKPIARLRLDAASAPGEFGVRRVAAIAGGARVELRGDQLSRALASTHRLRPIPSPSGELAYASDGGDAFLDFALPPSIRTATTSAVLLRVGLAAAAAAAWFLVERAARVLRRRVRPPALLVRTADAVTDDALLRVSTPALLVFAALPAIFVVWVALDLNQSSIHLWENIYGRAPVRHAVAIGTPKNIRFDEWTTATPWLLSQVRAGMPARNATIGGEGAPILSGMPVMHPTLALQPNAWGFVLFDVPTGFSWWWAWRACALFGAFFWFFLVLTRGATTPAFFGALWVQGSSFTQWWYSAQLVDIMTAFAATTIGVSYLALGARRRSIVVGGALLVFGCMNLLLHPYPPFIIPLAYLGIAIVVGRALEGGAIAHARRDARFRAAAAAVTLVVVGAFAASWARDAWPALRALADTVYPGDRTFGAGKLGAARVLSGFFEHHRFVEQPVPIPPTNASEASTFLLLFPLVPALVPLRARRHVMLAVLVAYCAGTTWWVLGYMPRFIEAPLQALGWSMVHCSRALVGAGIGSIAVCVLVFARVRAGDAPMRSFAARAAAAFVATAAVAAAAAWLAEVDPVFFTARPLVVGTLAVAGIAAGAALGRATLFGAGVVAAAIGPLAVNPLYDGIDAIEEKPILVAARAAGGGPADKWLVYGPYIFAGGMQASGLSVVGGTWLVPERDALSVLDPDGRFAGVWNRYAHVSFRAAPRGAAPSFRLLSPDAYEVAVDACGPVPRALGVTHVAYVGGPPAADAVCLAPVPGSAGGVRLYALR